MCVIRSGPFTYARCNYEHFSALVPHSCLIASRELAVGRDQSLTFGGVMTAMQGAIAFVLSCSIARTGAFLIPPACRPVYRPTSTPGRAAVTANRPIPSQDASLETASKQLNVVGRR